jgi:hypothetical protein
MARSLAVRRRRQEHTSTPTAKPARTLATTAITEGGAAGFAMVAAVPAASRTMCRATCRTRRRARRPSSSTRTTPVRAPTTSSIRRVEKPDPFKIGGVCRHVTDSAVPVVHLQRPRLLLPAAIKRSAGSLHPRRPATSAGCFFGAAGSDRVLQFLERPAPRSADFGAHRSRQLAV